MKFEEIYHQYHQKIYRLCLGYTNDSDWAKDLMQDTFIQVHLHLKQFRNESSIGTWVYRIAVNICLRQINKESRHKIVKMDIKDSAQEEFNDDERMTRLYKAISSLEKSDRLVITMMLEGIKNAEIAEVLGISEGNTRVKIHRIKKTLAKKLI